MNVLEQGLLELGIDFDSSVLDGFSKFYSFLLEENQKYNLTKITDRENFDIYHLLDSLLPYKLITGNTLCDVGSGGGFPAIPLKLVFPHLKTVMVDSLNKRVNFLNSAVNLLDLKDAKAVNMRAEEACSVYRENFDTVTARAVSSFPILAEICIPLVKVGGVFIAYKSDKAKEEILSAQKAVSLLGGKLDILSLKLPFTDITRLFAVVKKVKPTPDIYPRPYSKISKKPL